MRAAQSRKISPLRSAGDRRVGAILIVAIWVLFFLAALVIVFARGMRAELSACANLAARLQASAVERSAEHYAMALVDQQKDSVLTLQESYFAGIAVNGGYFWILRPNYGDDQLPLYGLVGESCKVNLNSASADMLGALPGMTPDLAAAIIDWRDEDTEPTAGGAEDEYYMSLPQPYSAKNAPLETVEEILLIRGITSEHLYGLGAGSRYGADPTWGSVGMSSVGTDPQLGRGIYDNLTIYSVEANVSASGQQRVNVNDEDPGRVSQILTSVLGSTRTEEVMERVRPRPPFRDIFDFAARAGLTAQEFESIADQITTSTRSTMTGLINVNAAPREVLLCLPGMTDADVTTLISRRQSVSSSATSSMTGSTTGSSSGIGWVADALGSRAIGLGEMITSRSYQYTADILAVSETGKAFQRCRVVIDARESPPKIVCRRDLTAVGWPLDPAILLSLREGQGLPAAYSVLQGEL